MSEDLVDALLQRTYADKYDEVFGHRAAEEILRLRAELSEAMQRLDTISSAFVLDDRAAAYLRPDDR